MSDSPPANPFNATLPSDDYAHGGVPAPARVSRSDATTDPERLVLRGTHLDERLSGAKSNASGESRFEILALLGNGATGQVFAARDRNLARDVAVKVLSGANPPREDIDSFVDEARTTAALDHPNVLPVHEIDITDAGQVYFTMKRIDGRSLGEAIIGSTRVRRDEALEINRLVSMTIALGHALAYSHHRGIVHQDIKPDNIMLGGFGEVLLVDWGSATRIDAPKQRLYGTPLYMAPEQARLEHVDVRSDVYCLGATLFHALILRPPTWSDDPEEFWRLKRTGGVSPPTDVERSSAPAALIDIALKALAPLPGDRYQRAEDLVSDLERYQAGLAVSAHRDSWLEAAARWHRRHARVFWSSAAAVTAIVVLGGILYGERLKEIATWGSPVLVERGEPGWRDRWTVWAGGFEPVEGGLRSTGGSESWVTLREPLAGDVAVEFDGIIEPECLPGDLSIFWTSEPYGTRRDVVGDVVKVQVGAFGNSYSAITGPGTTHYAYSDLRLEAGRTYRIRMEVEGSTVRMVVDGRMLCTYTDRLPLSGGFVTLYSYYSGHSFQNIRVFARGIAQKVPATEIGDSYLRRRLFDEAAAEYHRVSVSHRGTALAREAAYKEGLCRFRQGESDAKRADEAAALWRSLEGGEWGNEIAMQRLHRRFDQGERAGLIEQMESLYRSGDEAARLGVVIAWTRFTNATTQAASDGDASQLDALHQLIALHDRVFPERKIADRTASEALIVLDRQQEVLDHYPSQIEHVARALICLGRPLEILERFKDRPSLCAMALFASGRTAEITGSLENPPPWVADGAIERGEAAALLAANPDWVYPLQHLGRLQEVLDHPRATRSHRRYALMLLGRQDELTDPEDTAAASVMVARGQYAEALRAYGSSYHNATLVRHAAGLDAWIAGDRVRALDLFAVRPGVEFHRSRMLLSQFVIVPFLRELNGEVGAVSSWCTGVVATHRWSLGQHPWHCARYLLGEIGDAEFLAQPHRHFAPGELAICQGVRSELAGDRTAARAAYRRYLDIPLYRRGAEVDPITDRFARWRLEQLGAE